MSESHLDDVLDSPFGSFTLRRWPVTVKDRLRAWDSADETLLNYISQEHPGGGQVLIINDVCGALATALYKWHPVSWGDSFVSFRATEENYRLNRIDEAPITVPSTDVPGQTFDLVLIRIPKTTALLSHQLATLRAFVHPATIIIGAGMVKHMQRSAFGAFETWIGPVRTSLAVKKSRLIFGSVDPGIATAPPDNIVKYTDPDLGFALENLPNVFSRERLDHGARFFMSQFSRMPGSRQVIDLGCGNGVLGIYLQLGNRNSRVTFIDESYGAVESAKRNYRRVINGNEGEAKQAVFCVANALEGEKDESVDLILCNPPFHQQHVVRQHIAMSMISDSKRVLRRGGQLWIVANRHLKYSEHLKRRFGNCVSVATNEKFCVLKTIKR